MGFFRQFDEFDPLTGTPPDYPLSHLPTIVKRARALLRGRTRDEIVSAAHTVDFFIEEYFTGEKDNYIRRVLETGGWELGYLPYEARNEAGVRALLDDWPSEADDPPPDIPTSENTSEVDALKECIGIYVLDDDADFPRAREYEYFAVLALWLVADAVHWLKWTSDPKALTAKLQDAFAPIPSGAFPELTAAMFPELIAAINKPRLNALEGIPNIVDSIQAVMQAFSLSDTSVQFSHAGESAVCAMDAVCYAEHLRATESHAEDLAQLRIQMHQVVETTEKLAEEKANKKISVAASKNAIKGHAENHAMKAQVFAWCEANIQDYPSMDAAAEAVAGKLVPVAFRTARKWIGEYRKKGQSARRL